jgi:hypothetical protein
MADDRRRGARMQTFLPYADIAATVRALDPLRLGKQRVTSLQNLISSLTDALLVIAAHRSHRRPPLLCQLSRSVTTF